MIENLKRSVLALLLVAGVMSVAGGAGAAEPPPEKNSPQRGRATEQPVAGKVVPGQFIVVMKDGVRASAAGEVRRTAVRSGARVLFDYGTALQGFAAQLPKQARKAIENNPNVDYIEPNRTVVAMGDQNDPPWGLDRIDQRVRKLSRTYHYDRTGAGVTAYIIDSGIRRSHAQFGGRAVHGFSAIPDGRGSRDCNGHGTHVAGTVGGSRHGVAKGVKLVAVRVLDCNGLGTSAGVLAGVDWVTTHHQPGQPAVANMSLGGEVDQPGDDAVVNSIADGISYVVAAGNANSDACGVSPARVPQALTVGASTYLDQRAPYSNYGSCVDLFAPGSQVLSTFSTSDKALHIEDGTSMASPHVAGVVATYLQGAPSATPAAVANAVLGSATTGKLTGIRAGSPNRLLYSKFGSTNTSPPPPSTTNRVKQPGFESGPGIWQGSDWVVDCDSTPPPAKAGDCVAWLGGYGSANTTSIGQSGIKLPAGSAKTLRFQLRVATEEISSTTAFDKLAVRVVAGGKSTTLKTFSNLHRSSGYVGRSMSLKAFKGKTIQLRFVATEDVSRVTHFLVDNVSIS